METAAQFGGIGGLLPIRHALQAFGRRMQRMPEIQGLFRSYKADRRRRQIGGVEITLRRLAALKNPFEKLYIDLSVRGRSSFSGSQHKQMHGQDRLYLVPVCAGVLAHPDSSEEVHSAKRSGFDFDTQDGSPRQERNLHAIEIPFSNAMKYRDPGIQLTHIAVGESSKRPLFCCNLILVEHSCGRHFMQRPGAGARFEFFKVSRTPRVKGPALLRPRLNLTTIVRLS
ncbi:hypothetical protein [Allomesorhizobium camelthorni]|uniref:hypothetical protein n=1 Tax=Allomesorhizobium camelthorni TaxID=475069 RepID=UPI0031B580CB